MNGLFGNLQMAAPQPVHPDVAAAMGDQPTAAYAPLPNNGNPMSAQQQATSQWLEQNPSPEVDAMNAAVQAKMKYSVGNPTLDKYINMFLADD